MVTRRIGGRYRLLERRALGGMAAVWRGRDEQTGREVAVKLLHPHLAAEPDARRRLHREAQAAGAIDHPSVVIVRDIVLEPDAPAMVMDFVDGPSLAERLAAGGRMSEPEALAVAVDIAGGIAAAHAQGVVHRDIKPGNILLGPDGRAKVGDFGIAIESRRPDLTALTAEHGVVGTLRYLAPERLVGEAAVPATDVWGVGAVLYEMLAGRPAFDDARGVLGASRVVPPRPAGIRDATWAIIERALAPDPDHRFADGAALLAALSALPGVPARPGAASDAETARIPAPVGVAPVLSQDDVVDRTSRRRRSAVPAAVAIGASALLGVGGMLVLAVDSDRRAATEWSDGAVRSAAPTVPTTSASTSPSTPASTTASDAKAGGKPDKDRGKGHGKGRGNGNGG